jgi:hypothetical protein
MSTKQLATFLVATLVVGACAKAPSIGSDIVASIGGIDVAYNHFETYLRDNVDVSDLPEGSVLTHLFDQFLDEQLLVRLAVERGLEGHPVSDAAAVVDQRMAVAYLLQEAVDRSDLEVEVSSYYEAHKDDYQRPESVRLRQILVYERLAADEARGSLVAGEDFAQVAAHFSQVPEANLGGEQGRLAREDLPVAYSSIFELAVGEISEILATDYGFHIFQVMERFPAEAVPLSEAAREIRGLLERQYVDRLVEAFLDEARSLYNVTVHRSNFPFDYQGFYAHEKDS